LTGLKLAQQSNGKRRKLDFYPTPPECTIALMEFLKLDRSIFVWEPACGNEAMSTIIEDYVDSCYASDISAGMDYLTTPAPYNFGAIITNPPFSTALDFIRKALTETPVVAMLLKSQYWHAACRISDFKQSPPAWVLPLGWRPDFMGGASGGRPTMEVAWSVWIKGDTTTKYQPLEKPVSRK
jgi:hypothetical protein